MQPIHLHVPPFHLWEMIMSYSDQVNLYAEAIRLSKNRGNSCVMYSAPFADPDRDAHELVDEELAGRLESLAETATVPEVPEVTEETITVQLESFSPDALSLARFGRASDPFARLGRAVESGEAAITAILPEHVRVRYTSGATWGVIMRHEVAEDYDSNWMAWRRGEFR